MSEESGGNTVRRVIEFALRKVPLEKLFKQLKYRENALNITINAETTKSDGTKYKYSIKVSVTIALVLFLLYMAI